jgi:ribulose-phosphate 3-epimerase
MMTVGPTFIKTLLLKDAHLMIADPLEKVAGYAAAGADIITIHPEACRHPHRVLQQMPGLTNANDRARGIVRVVALNPGESEFILLLAVNPGWGGQKFIPRRSDASPERDG